MVRKSMIAVSLGALFWIVAAGVDCSGESNAPNDSTASTGTSSGKGGSSSTGGNTAGNSTSGGDPSAGGSNSSGSGSSAGGSSSNGGSSSIGGSLGAGGSSGTGGSRGTGGSGGAGGSSGASGATGAGGNANPGACDAPGLVWKSGSKTNFTSYPDPGSVECIQYSGCLYEGQFAACNKTEPKSWVMSHNIVAVFPDFGTLKLHDLCLKSGTKTIVVTALDTCGDADCNGCCTKNKGNADELIDVESFTDARWGVPDGRIQWADLGPTKGQGCQ